MCWLKKNNNSTPNTEVCIPQQANVWQCTLAGVTNILAHAYLTQCSIRHSSARGPFHSRFFTQIPNPTNMTFCGNSISGHQITTNFYTCHDSIACAKCCSDHLFIVCVRRKFNSIKSEFRPKNCEWNGLWYHVGASDLEVVQLCRNIKG